MTQTIKLIPVGNGVGVEFTPEMLERLGVHAGGSVSVSVTAAGVVFLKADDGFAEQMRVAERVMVRRQELLRKLAE